MALIVMPFSFAGAAVFAAALLTGKSGDVLDGIDPADRKRQQPSVTNAT
jgi:hypothetical protein